MNDSWIDEIPASVRAIREATASRRAVLGAGAGVSALALLAALATLQTAWIYNEFFWATVLLQSGDKFPVTSSLNNLKGSFFTDYNLLSAGSIIAALPILILFFVLQRQFVSGLTMGSTKG
ncbi:carbohydrate ABC transporter permease [Dermabacter hominis]|uniref:carbohydrate ABC transporter permease n=1 Tax=Dermabacter hominis TaxID=36740 RepID=UPI002882DB01|nr:carbohydrate ABC transporter permease [Dermabacter hominis]